MGSPLGSVCYGKSRDEELRKKSQKRTWRTSSGEAGGQQWQLPPQKRGLQHQMPRGLRGGVKTLLNKGLIRESRKRRELEEMWVAGIIKFP